MLYTNILFTKPEDFIIWLNSHDTRFNLTEEDSEMILGYMEGHGFALGTDYNGNLILQDIEDPDGEVEEYSMNDVINTVSTWNEELYLENISNIYNAKDFTEYYRYKQYEETLKAEQERLNDLSEIASSHYKFRYMLDA